MLVSLDSLDCLELCALELDDTFKVLSPSDQLLAIDKAIRVLQAKRRSIINPKE